MIKQVTCQARGSISKSLLPGCPENNIPENKYAVVTQDRNKRQYGFAAFDKQSGIQFRRCIKISILTLVPVRINRGNIACCIQPFYLLCGKVPANSFQVLF